MVGARRVLVVDDDPDIVRLLSVYLNDEGFSVSSASSEAQLWEQLELCEFDLILLDVLLPDGDGFDATRRLREVTDAAIILISRKDTDIDQIVGLELGADDYVVKPLVPRALLARIKSVLRRYSRSSSTVEKTENCKINILEWELDKDTLRMCHPDGRQLVLSSTEAKLLSVLVENKGKVITRMELMQALKDREWEYMDRSIDIIVARLRRKIEENPSEPKLIQTVRGVGYVYQPMPL